MKMKKLGALVFGIFLFLFGASSSLHAQATNDVDQKVVKVKQKTAMEQFEPGMVIPVEDRIRLKKERIAAIKKRREIIDTMNISDRKRRKLLKELYNSPFSDEWQKVVAGLELEDDDEDYFKEY